MNLDDEEYNLKKKCLKIINNNEVQIAIRKISNLKFKKQKLGREKAVNICRLYVRNFVDIYDKPDTFNYIKEINQVCRHLK